LHRSAGPAQRKHLGGIPGGAHGGPGGQGPQHTQLVLGERGQGSTDINARQIRGATAQPARMRTDDLAHRWNHSERRILAPGQRAAAQCVQALLNPAGRDVLTEQSGDVLAAHRCGVGTGHDQRRQYGQREPIQVFARPGDRCLDPGSGGQHRRISRRRHGKVRAGA
jgi:hypothetical protein